MKSSKSICSIHKFQRVLFDPRALLCTAYFRDCKDYFNIVQADLAIKLGDHVYVQTNQGKDFYRYIVQEGVHTTDGLAVHVLGPVMPF